MLLNQSFLRNLFVLLALCILLIEAAPVKVRRSRPAPGSSQDEIPRLPKRLVGQPFAPYRAYQKRQASSSSVSTSSSKVSVTSRPKTKTTIKAAPTAAFDLPAGLSGDLTAALGAAIGAANAPPPLASFLSAALGSAVSTTAQPTVTAAPAGGVPPAIASLIASELSVAMGGASINPAIASQLSSALAAAIAPTATTSVSSQASSSSSVSSSIASITSVSTAFKSSSASVSSTQATGTTVTVSVDNLPTPVVASAQGTTGLPSVSIQPPSAASCKPTNVFNRAELHANPRKNIALFKAVANDQATIANLVSNVTPPRNEKGDFSNTGAFYLTDTWQAAAQALCYGSGKPVDSVAIIQYNWKPMPDTKVLEFRSANTQWSSFIKAKSDPFVLNNDMIAGPADFRKDITTAFWQYAVNSDKGMQNLDLSAVYQPVFCKDIPKGNCLPIGQ